MYNIESKPMAMIVCLASYNEGKIHGKWVDMTQDINEIWDQINNIIKTAPNPRSEEWEILDYDSFYVSNKILRSKSIEELQEIAQIIIDNGIVGSLLLDEQGGEITTTKRMLENYIGCYESWEDYAWEYVNNYLDIPKEPEYYINYEKWGRDLELSGEIYCIEEGFRKLHFFHG